MSRTSKATSGVGAAQEGADRPPPRFEAVHKRVRAKLGAEFIADSRRTMLLWEPPRKIPLYYFPIEDVRTELLTPSAHTRPSDALGVAAYFSVKLGERVSENVAWRYQAPPPGAPDVAGYIAFKWDQVDAWYEEDDEVFVHPHDPYVRIDVLNSSRHVRIEAGGETIAETRRPRMLFETGLPVRYYIPRIDVRTDLLEPSDTLTQCPYKGRASHYSARVGATMIKDVAWSYPVALPEVEAITGLVSFYDGRVDAVYIDGELQPRPDGPLSQVVATGGSPGSA
jgi:uncharacterized protein (DUF427 family)